MFLKQVSPTEVYNVINELKNKTTLDTKNSALNQRFVKAFAEIVNKSFEQGEFPESLKTVKFFPIFKQPSKITAQSQSF